MRIEPDHEWESNISSWFAIDNDSQSLKDMSFYSSPKKWFSLFSQSRYGLAIKLEGKPIGFIDVDIEGDKARIAYYIAPAFRKRGMGKESLIQLENYLADDSSVLSIHAFVDPVNIASQALLKSLGYEAEALDEEGMILYSHKLSHS